MPSRYGQPQLTFAKQFCCMNEYTL